MESIFGNRKDNYMCIRGMADYRDGMHNKEWVPHSSLMAAAFMKAVICSLPSRGDPSGLLLSESHPVEASTASASSGSSSAFYDQQPSGGAYYPATNGNGHSSAPSKHGALRNGRSDVQNCASPIENEGILI